MQQKQILFSGKKISYCVYGTGKSVILLHGFGEDSTIWNYQIEYLKNECKLIVPDIPGSGKSELIPNANIDTYAEVLKAICDNENSNEKYTLIGHSMGGYITLAFAEKYPYYLNAFGLFHSTALPDNEEKKESRKKAIDFINKNSAVAFLRTAIPGLFSKEFIENNEAKVEALIANGNVFSQAALIQYYEAMIARPDRTNVLKEFSNPILFILGEHDKAVSFEATLPLTHISSVAYIHILRNTAHMGMWEETSKCNEILKEFVNACC